MSVLTIVDVTGTQRYIFGTNKLRENIGASEIVFQATDKWVRDLAGGNVVYCGGGNALLLFDNPAEAKEFARSYSKKVLQGAPNLDVVLAHSKAFEMISPLDELEISTGETDEFNQPITRTETRPSVLKIVDETFQALGRKKANRSVSAPLLGLSVSAQCVSTGGAANGLERKSKKYVSAESLAKSIKSADANARLEQELFAHLEKYTWSNLDLEVPVDFDHLGRTKGDASYIAVVHTDGNGMGKRVEAVGKSATDNKRWVNSVSALSNSIREKNTFALQRTIEFLLDNLSEDHTAIVGENGESIELIQTETDARKRYLPFRPLIFGGDDLTFVCDARIALDLTVFYLRELGKLTLSDNKPLYARAGIAIVKSHYPFARAYQLAEDLAQSAKEKITELDDTNKEVYALDWHVAMSGLFGSIEEIRRREYTVPQGKLNMRPLSLRKEGWQYWENFESVIKEFQIADRWKGKRNKVKALREALRGGSNETQKFLRSYQIGKLPNIEGRSGIENDGWNVSNICGYFDAIEMLDLYLPLSERYGLKE